MSFEICKWNNFLTPPQGYRPVDMLLLTYSLHPTALEEILVQSGLTRRYGRNPKELADHVLCFCQSNRWQDSDVLWNEHLYTRLLLAKKRIIGVENKNSSFHPKMMAILYENSQSKEKQLLRLVISSRNLTKTSNREGALCLETDHFNSTNNQAQWQSLEDTAIGIENSAVYQKLLQADFTACAGNLFGEGTVCEFLISGTNCKPLHQTLQACVDNAEQFVAVSPFLGSWEFIKNFVPKQNGNALILTNQGIPTELFSVSETYPVLFKCLPDSNGQQDAETENFLHAKMYAVEGNDGKHHLLIGSANFSENGFCRNTELMVHLTSEETNFCEQIRATLSNLGQCILQKESDTEPQDTAVPELDLTPDEVQELCKQILKSKREKAELANLFYQVFEEPLKGREPMDYAVDVLSQNGTDRLNVWRKNLKNYNAQELPDAICPYYNTLRELLGVEERE